MNTSGTADWTTADELAYIRYHAGRFIKSDNRLAATEVALVGWLEAADRRSHWDGIDKHTARFAAQERLRQVREEMARAGG